MSPKNPLYTDFYAAYVDYTARYNRLVAEFNRLEDAIEAQKAKDKEGRQAQFIAAREKYQDTISRHMDSANAFIDMLLAENEKLKKEIRQSKPDGINKLRHLSKEQIRAYTIAKARNLDNF